MICLHFFNLNCVNREEGLGGLCDGRHSDEELRKISVSVGQA